jgi:hypothetical protein
MSRMSRMSRNGSTIARWRGVAKLVTDAVEHGSKAVERIQKETAARPFGILEMIPGVAPPARAVHLIHDATVSGVHGVIRLVTHVVDGTVGVAFELADRAESLNSPPENAASKPKLPPSV